MTGTVAEQRPIRDVRALLDSGWTEPVTVTLDGERIAAIEPEPAGAGSGGYLIPGLIDAHLHLHGLQTLETIADYGITTAFDMGTWPPELVASLRNRPGLTAILSSDGLAVGSFGPHITRLGAPPDSVLTSVERAREMVAERVRRGCDFLKVVLDAEGAGPRPEYVLAYADATHEAGKLLVAHAATVECFELALDVGADIITHVPPFSALPAAVGRRVAEAGVITIPTLMLSRALADALDRPEALVGSVASVSMFHTAGVRILAGSDAHEFEASPVRTQHGTSLHEELELLVRAGLSPIEAIDAATRLPAESFGLTDRGRIAPGARADLVLLARDPLADIGATRSVQRIWLGGIEREPRLQAPAPRGDLPISPFSRRARRGD